MSPTRTLHVNDIRADGTNEPNAILTVTTSDGSAQGVAQDALAAPPRLLDRLRGAIRLRHYSIRTEATYVDWARRFILFHDKWHPLDMGVAEVTAFLTYPAVERNIVPSTQNQAKSALLFLYRVVLEVQLPWLDKIVAAKDKRRLPVVLTMLKVRSLLDELTSTMGLAASLLYGTGMRLLDGLRLRVKDVEFEQRQIIVREGKGGKDRVTVLPENLILLLKDHLARVKVRHVRDLADGLGGCGCPTRWRPNIRTAHKPGAGSGWFRAQ